MAKSIRKIFTTILALCICTCMIVPQALAAEITTETTTEGGITTTVTTTTETVVEGDTTTVTETVETDKTGTDEEGFNVVYNEVVEDKTETTEDETGTTVTESSVTDGSEVKDKTVETPDTGLSDVEVELIPGEETSNTVTDTETVVEGDVPEDESDTEYDYTETTTTTDRTVTTTTSEIEVKVEEVDTGIVGEQDTTLTGRAPVYDYVDGVKQDKGGMFDNQFNSGLTSKYAKNPENWDMPEDADVRLVGTGEHTVYYSDAVYVVYEKDADGNTVYDENGEPVIKEIWRYNPNDASKASKNQRVTLDGENATEIPDSIEGLPQYDNSKGPGANRPTIHALMDQNGNVVYGYCIDNMVPTSDGDWYKIINLEDSDYYASDDAENHVRNIVLNGYWGTTNIPDENGNYAEGSVELIKQKILKAVENGELESEVKIFEYGSDGMQIFDENGEPKYTISTVEEVIAGLTAGEAHIATQAAIWSYSNGSVGAQNGKDGYITIDPDDFYNHTAGSSKPNADILDGAGGARLDIVYTWLIGLNDDETSTVVINDKTFVEDTTLIVGDKVGEVEETDADGNTVTNGIYETSVSFALGFTPGEDDNLLMQFKYTDADAKEVTVTKRIAGKNAEGEDYEMLYAENGKYTFGGLKLSENKDFSFDLRLEGTQYLENGVYVYESLRGRESAQNFVGVAEGVRNVDVSMGVTVSFDVTEETTVTEEHYWHSETDPEVEFTPAPPVDDPEVPEDNDDNPVVPDDGTVVPDDNAPVVPPQQPTAPVAPPQQPAAPTAPVYIPDDAVPQGVMELDGEVIIDEEVPLADVPATGDNSELWLILSAAVIIGLVLVNLSNKKRTEA